MDKSAGKAGPEIAQRMQHWLADTDFTGVRVAEAIARLPEKERGDWQKLWEEVEAMKRRGEPAKVRPAATTLEQAPQPRPSSPDGLPGR